MARETLRIIDRHYESVHCIAFGPDGHTLPPGPMTAQSASGTSPPPAPSPPPSYPAKPRRPVADTFNPSGVKRLRRSPTAAVIALLGTAASTIALSIILIS